MFANVAKHVAAANGFANQLLNYSLKPYNSLAKVC